MHHNNDCMNTHPILCVDILSDYLQILNIVLYPAIFCHSLYWQSKLNHICMWHWHHIQVDDRQRLHHCNPMNHVTVPHSPSCNTSTLPSSLYRPEANRTMSEEKHFSGCLVLMDLVFGNTKSEVTFWWAIHRIIK